MTQKEKDLLLKDLCARLPYGVKCNALFKQIDGSLKSVFGTFKGYNGWATIGNNLVDIETVKPYLRLMSSMTIDELDDCVMNSGMRDIPCPTYKGSEDEIEKQRLEHSIKVFKADAYCIDWLNAHYFDYRGLIPMGLALEAHKDMYNIK